MSLVRLFFSNIRALLQDGILTVKEDLATIREGAAAYRDKWQKSEMRGVLNYSSRLLKDIFTGESHSWN